MSETAAAQGFGGAPSARRFTFEYAKLLDVVFWLTMFSGSVVFIEPSPYDFLILITLVLWAIREFYVPRSVLPFLLVLSLWVVGGLFSLIPYWNEPDPVTYTYHTLFITATGMFFALFTARRTSRRLDLLLSGYAASCVLAAAIAVTTWVLGYGEDGEWTLSGRAMAPFKDPNVLGSYLVTGVLYLAQGIILGRWRYLWLTLPSLALILTALFLSFSRGSMGACVIALVMMVAFLFWTADTARMRRTIMAGAVAFVLMAGAGLAAALSIDSVREFFFQRAAVQHDYDEGPTGRFGNQIRAIPMLLERPNGMGPLRYRLTFDLDPHSSYVNAFASNGWLGGFSFIAMVVLTTFLGFRQCLTRHPWMRQAQIVFPATFVFFLQGFQIDIDHWRMFYVTLGAVWGIEAARRRWLADRPARDARSA
ncbi:hypothetical protein GJ654_00515 [Rhodoblastus acidophilus]|jgi:hypothetical protein|uniref:O-antigen ligase-related domain-containing protein n=1 Tax=Rhodoblastus acidophilus TaxID=1074 RepID=A0A6N8DH44_RHOAC|nr:O-antigen ligase family protein [Rhodoblastus acidophilus]MCW2272553.1 O-antigen ligase [Rhodoblastus acidophilus]MTV29467.1 hypothetical protein [Rhodoblastus acidophilus]